VDALPLDGDEVDMRSVTEKANESAENEMAGPPTSKFGCCGGGGKGGRARNMCWHALRNVAPLVFIGVFSLVGGLIVWLIDNDLGVVFIMPEVRPSCTSTHRRLAVVVEGHLPLPGGGQLRVQS